jgi:uroporphyrinogen-III synthase
MTADAPLAGRTIVVTAPGRLGGMLGVLGANVVDAPVIAIEPAPLPDLDLASYDWVVFTSANAVPAFCAGLSLATGDNPAQKLAAVGPGTAAAVAQLGRRVDLVPDEAVGEALVDAFPVGSGRVLLPQAAGARPVVAAGLREKGWDVEVVVAYTTVAVPLSDEQRAAAGAADAIAFTSASTVTNYLDAGGPVPSTVVCIGPVTADAARQRGLTVAAVADPHTLDGVAGALLECLA